MPERSYHFIPGDRPRLFDRVGSLGADAYVFDLEDAVAHDRKSAARDALFQWFSLQNRPNNFFLRVNHHQGQIPDEEKKLLVRFPWLGVVYPKVETRSDVDRILANFPDDRRQRIALIESATALGVIDDILRGNPFAAVGLGLEDFLAESIFAASELESLVANIRTTLSLAAMRAGIVAVDTISTDIHEGDELERDCVAARMAGMTAKFSIHPGQLETINRTFSPSPQLMATALRLRGKIMQATPDHGYYSEGDEVLSPPKIRKLQSIIRNHIRE